jgi:EAL domain-containing protein (putative c-di-GMP-specific phosphodiesterase class I)
MDMSAFRDLDQKPVEAILQGTYMVAQAFGINTIIGGIESKEQVELVRSFGYTLGLGNGLSGELLPEEIENRHLLGL